MAKLKDLLAAVGSVVQDDELTAAVGADDLTAVEITDEGLTRIKDKLNGFLTVESAKNNPDIKEHFLKEFKPVHKKSFLGAIDDTLKESSEDMFGSEKSEQLQRIEDTNTRVKEFIRLAKDLQTAKPKDDELTKTIDGYKNQLKEAQTAHERELAELNQKIANQENEHSRTMIRSEFDRMATGYELADAYKEPEFRRLVVDGIFQKLEQSATLKRHPDSGISLYAKDDPNLELFDGSKRVEIKPWLDEAFQPYLTKKPDQKPGGGDKFDIKPPQEKQVELSAMAQDMRNRDNNGPFG